MTIKAYLILAALLVLAIGEGLLCLHFYRDGVAARVATEAKGLERMQQAVAAQKEKDDRDNQAVIQSLKQELADLGNRAALPAPHLRVCVPTTYARTVPAAGSAPSGTKPAQPPDRGGYTSVRSGTGTGADIGPGVHDLALAGAILAAYRERTVEWAVGQGGPIPKARPKP